MLGVAIRGLASRKLRAASTALAVVLGVALVAGTYILTDTIDRSFGDIFETALAGTDVVVAPREIVAQESDEPPAFPERLLDRVERVPGVAEAEGGIFSLARITDAEGEQIGQGFAPQFVGSTAEPPFETLTYVEGRAPEAPGDAALDAAAAEDAGIEVGDTIGILGQGPLERFEVVGLNRLGDTSFGGAIAATLTLPEAQRVAGKRGRLDQISIAAADGVPPGELRRRVERALPSTVRTETGSQSATRQSDEIASDLGFLQTALLVFGGVALVVGGFLIFNTFSITVAQRIREFGLLRTLGASRRQLLATVLGEALAIGLLGAALGLVGGIGCAAGIDALFRAIGIDLPSAGLVVEPRTIVLSVVLGVGLTLAAALTPALRATRVSPMAALLEAALPESRRRGRIAIATAALLAVGGLAALLYGLFGDVASDGAAAGLMGGGAAAMLFATSLFSPWLVPPLARLAGWPIVRLRGMTGRLARENAIRKPGRTAVTSAALMIGLALVVFVTIFAAGLSRSVSAAIDASFQGDLTIQSSDGFSPIPASVASEARGVEGVGEVGSLRFGSGRVDGDRVRVSGVDPRAIDDVFELDLVEGSPAAVAGMTDRQALVDRAYAESHDVAVGDSVAALTPTGERPTLEVVGVVDDPTDLLGTLVVTQDTLARAFGEQRDTFVLVGVAGGADTAAVQRRLDSLFDRRYPTVEALDQEELKQAQEEQINALVGLVYALLALAIVLSLFGIFNTLALSIHERTRELGLLRAVGMTRRQVRRVIRYEAVITALIGALLGTVLGALFAVLVSRPLADEGFELAFPIGQLVAIAVLAGLAGVVAAIGPARRAARLDVLRAVSYE